MFLGLAAFTIVIFGIGVLVGILFVAHNETKDRR